METRTFQILLVEDNPGDVRLTKEILKESNFPTNLMVAFDGEEAIELLNKKGLHGDAAKPDLVLLDLNLPRKNGLEVLKEIKSNEKLRHIPVVILTSSEAEHDVEESYKLHANSYIAKPVDFDAYCEVVSSIEKFWFSVARLPME